MSEPAEKPFLKAAGLTAWCCGIARGRFEEGNAKSVHKLY